MYNNPSQYTGQGYQTAYPQYQQNYNSGYGYEGYSQTQYMGTNVQPVPPGEEYPQNNWAPVGGYHANSVPAQTTSTFDGKNEDEAVAQERKAQNAQLIKQREEYVRKARVLRRELELLRNQKQGIMSENSSQRDMELILKENIKLQDEIQSKMKAIHNVIEMLSSIIKDGCKISDLEAQLDESPKTHHKNHVKSDLGDPSVKYNYMHYDPELHWCRMCDEFPKTAKDFLLHLQSDKHRNNIHENDVGDNTPWHKLPPEPELPCYEGAPKKRIPIRGLQFFISAPAWYCKLCDTWIGDLHCASHHLKSQAHFQNYANFVEQNPHWEIEWLKDREKVMARNERHGHVRSSDSDVSEKKKKRHRNKRSSMEASSKDKKKKKRSKKRRKHSSDTSSSSSSSDSSSEEEENNDKSKSIRVVMRNMKVQSIMNEDLSGKWEMLERLVDEHKKKEEMQKMKEMQKAKEPEDTLINQWMTVSEPQEKEKVLLDNLKDRMKQKQEFERAKLAELEKRQREKERAEMELNDRKVREEQEAKERFERERRERDREEYERIRDKDRNQVRFKTKDQSRDNYRKRRTPTPSPPKKPPTPPSRDDRRHNRDPREQRKSSNSRENGRESLSKEYRRSHSKSQERERERRDSSSSEKKKPPGPPTKRLPFIGRMPLFKNKKIEEKVEKEIKKEDYDIPRQTRFQPGNLARAFLPQPDVVCFPKLSSYPPLTLPPPPVVSQPDPPAPPKITEEKTPKAPPAPKIGSKDKDEDKKPKKEEKREDENLENMYGDPSQMMDPNFPNQYYPPGMDYNMMYSQSMYEYCEEQPPQPPPPDDVPLSHTMPLQPPPLPPNDPSDDLAMLGISADDMAAQSF